MIRKRLNKVLSWWALRHLPAQERKDWVSIVGEDYETIAALKARREAQQ